MDNVAGLPFVTFGRGARADEDVAPLPLAIPKGPVLVTDCASALAGTTVLQALWSHWDKGR